MESFVTALAALTILALLPGSFVGAYFLSRKWVKDTAARVFITIGLGLVFLVGGISATVAGCTSMYPLNIR